MEKNIRKLFSVAMVLILMLTAIPLKVEAQGYDVTYGEDTNIETAVNFDHVIINSGATVALKAPDGKLSINADGSLSVSEGILTADDGQLLEIGSGATVSGISLYANEGNPSELVEYTEITMDVWELAGDITLQFRYNADEEKWILKEDSGEPEEPEEESGGGGEPQNFPTYRVRYDSNAMSVKLGNDNFDAKEGQNQNYPELTDDADDLVFSFQAKNANENEPINKFYGLKVTIYGESQTVRYIKAGATELLQTGSNTGIYTYSIAESNFTDNIEIEVISWEMAFDNEFIMFYDNGNNAGVSYSIGAGGQTSLSNAQVNSFNCGTIYTFTLTPPIAVNAPFKIVLESNDGTRTEANVNNNVFTWTPENINGCIIRVYWTEAQYNFENLHAEEGQYEIEYAWFGNGTVNHAGGVSSVSNGNVTKVVLANGTTNITLTLIPTPGETPESVVTEVRLDGQAVAAADYISGTYVMALNDNYKRLEVRFTEENQSPGGEEGGGESENVPERNFNIKENIESRNFAYAGNNSAIIKEKFVKELWSTAFENNVTNSFSAIEDLDAEITVEESLQNNDSEIVGYSYYSFIIDIDSDNENGDTDDISGRIYILGSERDFVVRTTRAGVKTFTVVAHSGSEDQPERAELVKDYDEGGVFVFGNGTEVVGGLGSSDYFVSGHVTNEHVSGLLQFGRQVAVYKPDFSGVGVTPNGETGYAAAWGFAQFPMATTNNSTEQNPAEYEVFFGNTSVTLSRPMVDGTMVESIENVTTTLSDVAVRITSNGEGADKTFCVEFLSDFYDEVPVSIIYNTADGAVTQYLTIRRVGIDIAGYRQSGDHESDLQLNHGTDPGPVIDNFGENDNEYGIFATYYYPTGTETANVTRVELYVTKTWYFENGSVARVERETIANSINHANAGELGSSVALDDFQIYAGSILDCPDKVEIITLERGSNNTTFKGAKLGGGAGVVWEK